MKFKLTFFSFISSLSLCALTSPLVNAQTGQEEAARWFEVEVILFKQLGDKKLLKEQFTNNVQLPNYANYYDLLTPYLQPDITSLKQQLSSCESEEKIENAQNFIQLTEIKSLSEINEIPLETTAESELSENDNSVLVSELEKPELDKAAIKTQTSEGAETEIQAEEVLLGLTQAQLALLTAAEQEFSLIQFNDTPQYPYFPNKSFCIVNNAVFQQNSHPLGDAYLVDSLSPVERALRNNKSYFPVSEVPTTISPSGLRSDSQPYLIHKDSLQLQDIITRLKWSKNFKPLLHLGWRQIGITRNDAIPIKIYAGEHLEESYQAAINTQKEKQKEKQASDEAININSAALLHQEIEPFTNEDNATNVNSTSYLTNDLRGQEELATTLTMSQQQQITQLKHIFENIKSIDGSVITEENIEQLLITSTDEQSVNSAVLDDDITVAQLNKPVQPWLLDGFFKLHLDHYLYITADFSIARNAFSSEKNQKTNDHKTSKTIGFSQDKRVISGEVHYFDHPYMGMIVQIRRFDPTKSDEEAVTQAVR